MVQKSTSYGFCTSFIEKYVDLVPACPSWLNQKQTKLSRNKPLTNLVNVLVNTFAFALVKGKELNAYIGFISAFDLLFG